MWFKNLRIFRLTSSFDLSHQELNDKLAEHPFQACGKLDLIRRGWMCPLGRHGEEFVHSTHGYMMLALKQEEKILPSSVVKEHLEAKVNDISEAEGRHVGSKEKESLKDEIIFSLLPKAFTKARVTFGYISLKEKLVVIDASSAKSAEDFISSIRDAVGTIPCIPLSSAAPPSHTMTQWLRDTYAPQPFTLGEECELRAPKDEAVIRCKNQDLTANEVLSHIETGMYVNKLALSWKEGLQLILDNELSIKRLKFENDIRDKAESSGAESAAEEFDREFAVMSLELSALIKDLLHVLGGETDY